MSETKKSLFHIQGNALRLGLIVYDIVAINASFLLTLLVRFYVGNEFHFVAAKYFAMFVGYTPFYTLFCLAVFGCFKLYSGVWKYAGLNDFNRIALANVICLVVHVAGTLLAGIRMPISVYCIGGLMQFALIVLSRFVYRLLMAEKERINSGRFATVNALIVGAGGTGRMVVKQMQSEGTVRPVCVLDYNNANFGSLLDGVPVVTGVHSLGKAIETYRVGLVIIATAAMPQSQRKEIRDACHSAGVEVQDYSGFFGGSVSGLTLRSLAECAMGEVEIIVNGQSKIYTDCEQALLNVVGRYTVKSIGAKGGRLVVELTAKQVVLNDLNADWVKAEERSSNESISFF